VPDVKVVVLGSGIAAGVPAWNDGSPLALRARAGDPQVPVRRGTALAVSADGLRYTLVEAPFHLAETLTRDPRFAPAAGSRRVPIDGLVLTCGDLDATAGALALTHGLSLRIASTRELREALADQDGSFRQLAACWTGHAFDRPFPLDRDGELEARFFPLPGPAPDALRDGAPRSPARAGLRITDRRTGSRLVFAPRIARYDGATLAELRSADVRLVDGTFLQDEEGRLLHPGSPSALALGHRPIDGRDGSLVWLSGMSGRSIYVHLAATNPACDVGSKEWARIHEAGVLVAYDGMELEL
jgi:pyrroloquinoline quinone biosynthesis protein B